MRSAFASRCAVRCATPRGIPCGPIRITPRISERLPLEKGNVRNETQDSTTQNKSGPGGTQTHTRISAKRILSPQTDFRSGEKTDTCDGDSEAPSSSPGSRNRNQADSDPDLAKVTDAWPALPEAIKAGIVAMVRAAT